WAAWGSAAASLLGAVLWIAVHAPQATDTHVNAVSAKETITRPEIIERRDGRLIWRLIAERAEEAGKQLRFVRPHIVLYDDQGREAPIDAKEGYFDPVRRRLKLTGGVEGRFGIWRFAAPWMDYDPKRDLVRAPEGVLSAKGVRIAGKRWRVARARQIIEIGSEVHAQVYL
ncbi:MAG: hypothetical protein D6771_00535, partial [Zetaproteobacteria bacterium]